MTMLNGMNRRVTTLVLENMGLTPCNVVAFFISLAGFYMDRYKKSQENKENVVDDYSPYFSLSLFTHKNAP